MAVAPLFVANMTKLKTDIRMGGVESKATLAVIDRVVQEVRRNIYKKLGQSQIDTLLAVATVENPTTADQYKRLDANLLETLWVEYLLLNELPVLIYDASVSTPPEQMWNEEPLTRDASDADELQKRLSSLMDRINELLDQFTETSEGINVHTFEPETAVLQNSSVFEGGLVL